MTEAGRPLDAETLRARAAAVRVVGFDVDGVCTDGRLFYGPSGEALHAFHAQDGLGIARARSHLLLVAVTGRKSKNVEARLSELKVPHILQGIFDKAAAFQEVLDANGFGWDQAAFIGDDVNDVPCLQRAALGFTVPNAVLDVFPHAHAVTRKSGGHGALRELLETVLKAQGHWTSDR
jgi:3-deoxy-D-manno-octulosonate 8-phosphate phosphatase (KDO 8-P phosphatase)